MQKDSEPPRDFQPARILRRYLPSRAIQPEELFPFGITEFETGAKVSASSVKNINSFSVIRQRQQWITRLNERPCGYLKSSRNLDDVQILSEELDQNPDLIGIPLREPDSHYIGRDTYITMTRDRELQRFSSQLSLGIFSPSSAVRQAAISVACSAHFQAFVICIIILDFLALVLGYADDPIIQIGADLFFAFYCAELAVKVIAFGFVIDGHSFLRNGHSIVEVIVIVSNVLPMIIPGQAMLKQLRVIRVIRLFRLIGTLSFTRKIMSAVVSSLTDLVPVFVLFLAIVSFFSLVSLVFYRGSLLGKCVTVNYEAIFSRPGRQTSIPEGSKKFHAEYLNWTDSVENWQYSPFGAQRCPVITKSSSWWMSLIDDRSLRKCPQNYSCVRTSTGNPDMGFSNYDTLMLSMLSTFRLLCQDWWDNLFVQVTLANGGHSTTLFFLALIFLGSHYIINLVLSTITLSYQHNEQSEKADMEEQLRLAVIMHINRDNYIRRQVEVYNMLLDQGRTILNEPKFLANLPENPVPKSDKLRSVMKSYVDSYRAPTHVFGLEGGNNPELSGGHPEASCMAWLDRVLRNTVVRNKSVEHLPIDTFVNLVILMNVIEMLVVTPVQKQSMSAVENTNIIYTIVFTLEALLKIRYQRTHYLRSTMNRFDLVIVIICLTEIMLPFVDSRLIKILRMTRFLRLFKLARVSKELEKLITIVLHSFKSEVPLIIVSFTVVIISAGIGMVMFQETYKKHKVYQKPTQNFVDIYNSILLVFRIMCGEWIENLWVCMKIMESGPEKGFCVIYFLCNQIIVNLIIFKLYIGILLNKFSEYRAEVQEERERQASTSEEGDDEEVRTKSKKLLPDRIKGFLTNAFGINFDAVRRSTVQVKDTAFARLRNDLSAIASNSTSWYVNYIIIMTILSSTALVLDDYYLKSDPGLREIGKHLEIIFFVVFATELLLKMVAYGPIEYVKSPWRLIDASIVLTTMVDLIVVYSMANPEVNLTVMRVFRTLRCLRILRTANVWEGFKLTISALFRSVRKLFFAFVIVIVVWLMFALVSTSLFSNKFYRCVQDDGTVLPKSKIWNKTACAVAGYKWENKRINFDTIPAAMLALLEISVFKGWIDIFQDVSNAPSEIGLQPDKDNNSSLYVLIYIFFIIIGSFFMIGMLIGVIVDSFEGERKKLAHEVLTEGQVKLQNTLKQVLMFPLKNEKPRPDGWLSQMMHSLNKTIYVEVFYLVLILASTVVMALQYHPGQSELAQVYHAMIDDAILVFFVFELMMKILAEGTHYLMPLLSWNLIDFSIVMLSLVTNLCHEAIDLQYLRVVRFARVFRMGRLLARSTNIKTVRDILLAMVTTLPSMLNMIALLIMAICIFAIVGVNLFSHQEGNDEHPFNEMFNFRSFAATWRMLFIVSTAAGFNDYLDGTMRFPQPYSSMGVAFWVSYLCLSFFVLTNLIVSAVVSSYNEVFDSQSSTVRLQTAETFTNMWNDFDQRGTGRMHARHISELLDLLSEPLRVQLPNTAVISLMKIPLSEDYYVSHSDMVRALIKEVLDHMGIADHEAASDSAEKCKPIMDTFILHKFRMATTEIKIAWWRRKLRHAVVLLR